VPCDLAMAAAVASVRTAGNPAHPTKWLQSVQQATQHTPQPLLLAGNSRSSTSWQQSTCCRSSGRCHYG
jgi:hypothetical protein